MAAINYQNARFVASYGTLGQLPDPTTPEVSFAGRSNVGKSSLLNRLVGRKALAKVSSQPGKTANINFFVVDDHDLVAVLQKLDHGVAADEAGAAGDEDAGVRGILLGCHGTPPSLRPGGCSGRCLALA